MTETTSTGQSIENEIAIIRRYLHPANPESSPFCSDEREGDGVSFDTDNPPELPGGTYVIVDGLKKILKITETQAREMIVRSGIALGAHGGPEHKQDIHEHSIGPLGCGYGLAVETNPDKVNAPESVPVADRYTWVSQHRGRVYTVTGPHKITHVTMVVKPGFSIDSDEARKEGLGVLGCDAWIAKYYAEIINRNNPQSTIHPDDLVDHVVKAFEGVHQLLAPNLPLLKIE